MTAPNVNLAILVLGALWLVLLIASMISVRAGRYRRAAFFALPVFVVLSLMLTRFA
jgi:hypothetical protein